MEFKDTVLKRRMVRNFADQPVSPETIQRIVDLTRHAPSAGFTQGQSFVVVTHPETKQAIAETCRETYYVQAGYAPFISRAPVLLIPCASEAAYHRRYQEPDKIRPDGTEIEWPIPYWFMDIGCAVMIALLAAVDEGLVAAFAGLALGSSQATSRSLMARLTPPEHSAEFFGFYDGFCGKASAVLGPLLFGFLSTSFGQRPAIISLGILFVFGLALMSKVRDPHPIPR